MQQQPQARRRSSDRSATPARQLSSPAPPRVRRRLRTVLRRFRFLVAAVCVGLAAAITVDQLSPEPPPTSPVLLLAAPLPAGSVLTAAHVTVAEAPDGLMPEDALSAPAEAEGRTLAVTATEGTVLSAPLLVADDSSMQGPPGTVVAAVRLAEPALATLLSPGMHLDLLAPTNDTGPSGAEGEAVAATYLARRALLLPTPHLSQEDRGQHDSDQGGLLSLGSGAESPAPDLVLVAVTPEEAAYLANVAGWSAVSAVVVQ